MSPRVRQQLLQMLPSPAAPPASSGTDGRGQVKGGAHSLWGQVKGSLKAGGDPGVTPQETGASCHLLAFLLAVC